jgi:ubiquinone/menaquinone biosynthesis C-methylase UbiE
VNQAGDVLPLSPIIATSGDRDRLKKRYRRIARWYDLLDLPLELGRYRRMRRAVFHCVRDSKNLLDCGTGTGRNANYYPPRANVVAFDVSAEMIARARSRLSSSTAIVLADAVQLPFASHTFDAATATFLFCVLPDELQTEAIREVCRVLKPRGRLVLLDYVLSRRPLRRAWMKLWSPWVDLAYGASFTRNTGEHLRHAGVEIEQRRFLHADAIEMIVGTAPGL